MTEYMDIFSIYIRTHTPFRAEFAVQEKELQQTIEKLRKENRNMAAALLHATGGPVHKQKLKKLHAHISHNSFIIALFLLS